MATTNMIKFFKGANAPTTLSAGLIWFCTTDRTIRVYTGTEWEKYAGLVNAAWNDTDKKLTITDAAGSTTTLDLSDCASAKDMTAKLQTINNTLDSHNTRINTAQAAAEAAQGDVDALEGVVADNKADIEGKLTAAQNTINAELEKKADKTQVATDIATAKGEAIAAAAEDATSKANAAKSDAIAEAQRLDGLMDARVDVLEAAVGAGGSVENQIVAKINELDADKSGESADKKVKVQVVETDGVLTNVVVTTDDIASAQALADEVSARGVAEQGLSNRIEALAAAETGRVSILEAQVAALNAATHFEGKVEGETFDAAVAAAGKNYEAGDIVIYGNKEFIYDGESWIELGDTTAESDRISQLESWKTTAAQSIADNAANIASNDTDILNLQNEVSGIKNTMATDDELEGVRSDLQGKLDTANASISDHKTRIEALEAVADDLNDSFVNEGDYATDQAEVANRIKGVEDRATDLETFKSTTEVALGNIATAQGEQDAAIEAAAALGQKGIDDAADALAEAKAKVASVTSDDAYAVVDNTDAKNPKIKVNVNGAVAENNKGIVTGGAVYESLCWVEFN